MAGAALTATSVGITARVLNDLGRLHEPESQIVLGAAVIDDILGLIILTVVSGLAEGHEPTVGNVAGITALAFGFLIGTLVVGSFVVPPLVRWLSRLAVPGMLTTFALLLAFGLAWGAEMAGIGLDHRGLCRRAAAPPHAAGPRYREGDRPLGALFRAHLLRCRGGVGRCPHLRARTMPPAGRCWPSAELLIVVAVLGKFAAGYVPFWFRGKKAVIGVGMIPRGEVGLIFAQMGLATGVFDQGPLQRRHAHGHGHHVHGPAVAQDPFPAQESGKGRDAIVFLRTLGRNDANALFFEGSTLRAAGRNERELSPRVV